MVKPAFPDGHFYSPVVSVEEAEKDRDRLWPDAPELPGIDFNSRHQLGLLMNEFPRLIEGFDYEENGPSDDALDRFYESNGQFENIDPRTLFCMLRMLRPRRIVEVGSGYSTLVMQDVNARFLNGGASITCVEPFPRPFLLKADAEGSIRLLRQRAQDVDQGLFLELRDGDVLFIDSSHVSKTGSDVNRLILNILPKLNPGVHVHLHDIFLPDDYPEGWVLREGRSWNEQYLLQAFLAFNRDFEVVFGAAYAAKKYPRQLSASVGKRLARGGSFWIRRKRAGLLSRLPGFIRR
jgi:predicted O-methyltransferase YrrM